MTIVLKNSQPDPQQMRFINKLDDSTMMEITCVLTRQMRPKDIDNLHTYCIKFGLTLIDIGNLHIDLVGSAGSFSSLFRINFGTYADSADRTFFSHDGDVYMPAELDFIDHVFGLDSMPLFPKTHEVYQAPLPTIKGAFTPKDLKKLYQFPTNYNGTGQTIGIISLGGGFNQTDLATYFKELNLVPVPTVITVSVNGIKNVPFTVPKQADFENALDIQVASIVAPRAKIVVYFAPNTSKGLYNAFNTAINDTVNKPNIISNSWCSSEKGWSNSSVASFNALLQTAAQKNITVCCAVGNSSSNEASPSVDFPASSPYVVACGGTSLVAANSTTIQSEVVWNTKNLGGIYATGGGYSTKNPKPGFQSSIKFPAGAGRGVPDVACNCASETGIITLVNGKYYVLGGTSAAAPFFAGLFALACQAKKGPIGYINQKLYQSRSAFNDILGGNNGVYHATSGWDPCTGMGSPKGAFLVEKLK